jgi:hypothetical protein
MQPYKYALIAVIAFAVSMFTTSRLIPFLKHKQFGQFIREDGPQAHLSKAGTPTMGGAAMVVGITVALLASSFITGPFGADKLAILLSMFAFGFIGFVDDCFLQGDLGICGKKIAPDARRAGDEHPGNGAVESLGKGGDVFGCQGHFLFRNSGNIFDQPVGEYENTVCFLSAGGKFYCGFQRSEKVTGWEILSQERRGLLCSGTRQNGSRRELR